MRKLATCLAAVATIAAVPVPSTAQWTAPPPAQSSDPLASGETREHAGRLLLGVAGVGNGFYCSYGYALSNCSTLWNYSYAPLLFGAEVELGHRSVGIALGLRDLNGPYLDVNRNFLEPTADLVFRAGSYAAGALLRIRIGAGMYIGESGKTGWVGRGGLGFSIRGRSALGLALDAVWEGGGFEGATVSTVQLSIGPEISF